MNIVNKLQAIVEQLTQHSVCWSCGLQHRGQKLTCDDCYGAIRKVAEPCVQCGLSHAGQSVRCVQCLTKPKLWHSMVAPLSYASPISDLVQQLKFNQKLEVLQALMELLLPTFQTINDKPQLVIPVPLHANRYMERGFNQSHEIGLMLSKALNISYSNELVQRVVDTPRQSELSLKKRAKNIKNAFDVCEALSAYEHIVIVDDVITSGSTVHELTKQCLKIGVKRVDVWALARTELD